MFSDFHIIDDEPDESGPPSGDDRLNRTRIRAIAGERQAAYRRLLWGRVLLITFACLTVMTGVNAFRVEGERRGWFAAGSFVFLFLAVRAALRLHNLVLPTFADDATRPDPRAFDALSDGSQLARGLDDLARRRE